MTDVTIISYLLPANLSFQQSRDKEDKGSEAEMSALNNRWQCATTEGRYSICKLSESSLGSGRLEAVLWI